MAPTVSLLNLFDGVDLSNTDAILNIIESFDFPSGQAQSEALQLLREKLGATHAVMAQLMQLHFANWMKLAKGTVRMKPLQLRFLLLQLLIRRHNPDLFWRLIGGDQLGEGRSAPRF
ncbi:MAG: hypothetical protein ACR2PT_23685 [Endozoicomonas sp.]